MIKYFLFIVAISFVFLACNQGVKQKTEETATITDSTTFSKILPATEIMKVSELSAEELKDDSVFADGSKPASWANAGITDEKGLKLFIKKVQQWIVTNDRDSLASVIKYPVNKTIKSKEDFISNYDAVFNKQVQLSFATVNFSQLFRNAKGVMTNDGKVWIGQTGKSFKIIAINP